MRIVHGFTSRTPSDSSPVVARALAAANVSTAAAPRITADRWIASFMFRLLDATPPPERGLDHTGHRGARLNRPAGPRRRRARERSQVVPAVREIEALVAEREVGDLLVAQRELEAAPVVEGGIDDLVAREAPVPIRDRHVADL